jgi:hypothetical protein
MNAWKHFKTITHHKRLVLQGCFKVGLYWQGLTHDLSKYTPTEFRIGAKYYQGTRSPNAAEREDKGYSEAWMHHKGRNKHHYEYWTDMSPVTLNYESCPMPRKYLVEMIMDRRAACMTYQGKNYKDNSALEYFLKSREKSLMHILSTERNFRVRSLSRRFLQWHCNARERERNLAMNVIPVSRL